MTPPPPARYNGLQMLEQCNEQLVGGEGAASPVGAAPSGESALVVEFPQPAATRPCSFNRCTKGHTWPVQLQVVMCEGCATPVLVKLQGNCPWCNEPVEEMNIRIDQLINKQPVTKVCKGEASPRTGNIQITRDEDEVEPGAKHD